MQRISTPKKRNSGKKKEYRIFTINKSEMPHGSDVMAREPMVLGSRVTATHPRSSILMYGNILTTPWRHRPRFSHVNVSWTGLFRALGWD